VKTARELLKGKKMAGNCSQASYHMPWWNEQVMVFGSVRSPTSGQINF